MAKPTTVGAADLAQPRMFPETVSLMATHFYVPANSLSEDLSNDAGCLECSARQIIELTAMALDDATGTAAANPKIPASALHGAMYLLDIAASLRILAGQAADIKGGVS